VSFVESKGYARLDRRTKDLTKRLGPDDVAIIDHADLERVSAEELVESETVSEGELLARSLIEDTVRTLL
jgi:uncharacterized membrane-anchored protein